MVRRALIGLALVVVLCMASGVAARQVKTKTYDISHLARSDTAGTVPIGVTGYRHFWIIIDEVVGDTLATDSVIWIVQTRPDNDNPNDNPWISAYTDAVVSADSASYPLKIYFDAVDSMVFDQIRIKQNACLTCDTAWTDSGAAADSGFATYKVRINAARE